MTFVPIPRSRFSNLLTVSTFASNSFLCDVSVYDVDPDAQLIGAIGCSVERLAARATESGSAEVTTDPESLISDSSAAIAIPVYRGERIVSVAVLSSKKLCDQKDDVVGVFEVWEPFGIYEEVSLKDGYYGRMERFHNVSSFVRFEKGNGLPGQVWQQRCGVVHDDLSNHPGFLRAAGASAEILQVAIGIPVACKTFYSAAVLISSGVSPLARGFEVWQVQENRFTLAGSAYSDSDVGIALELGTELEIDAGLPGLARNHGRAVLCSDIDLLLAGRKAGAAFSGLAIPFFEGETLTSVTTLLF